MHECLRYSGSNKSSFEAVVISGEGSNIKTEKLALSIFNSLLRRPLTFCPELSDALNGTKWNRGLCK